MIPGPIQNGAQSVNDRPVRASFTLRKLSFKTRKPGENGTAATDSHELGY
jgi:hypothetical protein